MFDCWIGIEFINSQSRAGPRWQSSANCIYRETDLVEPGEEKNTPKSKTWNERQAELPRLENELGMLSSFTEVAAWKIQAEEDNTTLQAGMAELVQLLEIIHQQRFEDETLMRRLINRAESLQPRGIVSVEEEARYKSAWTEINKER